MEIVAFDKSTLLPKKIIGNNNNIYTTNYLRNLIGVNSSTSQTNNNQLYFQSSLLIQSRLLVYFIRQSTASSFVDISLPATINNAYKVRYNSVALKWYGNIKVYGYSYVIGPPSSAGKANLASNLEKYLYDTFSTTGTSYSGNLSGFTYASGIFSITSVLNRLFLIKAQVVYPFGTLTLNSKLILRIRKTNINGEILAQSSFINSGTANDDMTIAISWIGLNPVSYCFTLQLESGAYVLVPTRSCNFSLSVREIN